MAFKFTCMLVVLSVVFLFTKADENDDENIKQNDGDDCTPIQFPTRRGISIRASAAVKDKLRKIRLPEQSWIQTPSIVNVGSGHYQAIGRVIHLKHLKELLQKQQNFNFDATRKSMDGLVAQLDILADTLYIEGTVRFYGIKKINIYVREITATLNSHVYFSSPNWKEVYARRVVAGTNGEDGKDGIDGPEVSVFCEVANGIFDITSEAGKGKKGQDGGNGVKGRDNGSTKSDISTSVCKVDGWKCRTRYVAGRRGANGYRGGNGGNAGKPGNGGEAGWVHLRANKINGEVTMRSCRGKGAVAAKNGRGGRGGAGGLGGRGRYCRDLVGAWIAICQNAGQSGRASSGSRGPSGRPGRTSRSPGRDGNTDTGKINLGKYYWENKWNILDTKTKKSYPLAVINIIRRRAEDLLLNNVDDEMGKDAFKFILSLANERSDLNEMKKDVKRKLGFLGKDGYDIFGKNEMFAPRVKWQSLENTVKDIKDSAESYENAFNEIMSTVKSEQNFQKLASKMSAVSSLQVNAERKRLEEAKLVAESQKRAYVKSIEQQEEQMTSIITNINSMFSDVYKSAKFNANDFMTVLQGVVGFSGAIASKDPFASISTVLGVAGSMSGKGCLKSLESYMGSIKTWLTFGQNYKPLVDSSELNFDQLDVSSVPQIMKANLEMNKEKFTAELVCLLEVPSRPQDVADFKQLVESFFIAGAARIDLIAEIMDLDNDIGGYNFDIPLLAQTEKAIKDATQTQGAPITKQLQQTFMDNLLSTYRELERSFMKNVYELYKAFKFRTLWEEQSPLATFRRLATESAKGTGRLNGVVQLTQVLRRVNQLKDQANKCFTYNRYTTDVHRWSFTIDDVRNKRMFQDLASKGHARFSIDIDKSCKTCYNVRLLKIYIELLGKEKQPDNVPQKVYLRVRHLSGSLFRVPPGDIKQYYQPVASYRTITFNRFALSDKEECKERKRKGQDTKSYCVTEDDSRWHAMCNHALNKRGSHNKDALLGMEECQSPFGIYDLKIPVDKNRTCNAEGITNTNCKDLDLTKFTQMNVWTHYVYWAVEYPKGPDDIVCRKSQEQKRNETASIQQGFSVAFAGEDQF